MTLDGPVLVGTDLTTSSDAALQQGRRLADDLGGDLIVCHVLPEILRVRMLFPQWGGIDPAFQEGIALKAQEALDTQLSSVLGGRGDVRVLIVSGSPHAGLLTQADADGVGIVVTGPGRVATQVVRHARVPVLVARPSQEGAVVGATDFSDPSLPALAMAATEARRRGSRLHLLHAVDIGAYSLAGATPGALAYGGPSPALAVPVVEDLRAAAHTQLQASLAHFDIDGDVEAIAGPAATTIVTRAGEIGAQLIVVGTHGRTGLARLTLGSTAERVIETAPCSVLVVRLQT
jgi:nucleotide-binding universal stress UspA family protein